MVLHVLDAFWEPGDALVQGGCVDVDAFAAKHAHELGMHVTTLLALHRDWTDIDTVEKYSDEVIETGLGYWARDRLEVKRSDKVLAFPMYEQRRSSPQSGTWHTWNASKLALKHCALVTIRPDGPLPWGVEGLEAATAVRALTRDFEVQESLL
jgi:hypothetical protein